MAREFPWARLNQDAWARSPPARDKMALMVELCQAPPRQSMPAASSPRAISRSHLFTGIKQHPGRHALRWGRKSRGKCLPAT